MRRPLSVFMSVVLTVGLFPIAAHAETGTAYDSNNPAIPEQHELLAATTGALELLQDNAESDLNEQASSKLTDVKVVDSPNYRDGVLYVRNGDVGNFTIQMTNSSGGVLDYITQIDGTESGGASSEQNQYLSFPNPAVFSDKSELQAENATWLNDQLQISRSESWSYAGFSIARGATAKIPMSFNASSLDAGSTQTYTVVLGRKRAVSRSVTANGYTQREDVGETVEEEYCTFDIKVNVYDTPAQLTVGTGESNNLTLLPSGGIDFGTVRLGSANEQGSIALTAVNSTDTSSLVDGNQNTASISLHASWGTDGLPYLQIPLSSSGFLENSFATLRPAKATSPAIDIAPATISYDVSRFIAGTYTVDWVLNTTPNRVSVNGGATSASGEYRIPVTVKVEGTNANLLPAATDLSTTAGNGLVELGWKAASASNYYTTYDVWRRDCTANGVESQTDANKLEWAKYEKIGSVVRGSGGTGMSFIDGDAENGRTYVYTVIVGNPYQGYAAAPSAPATPLASIESRMLAPEVSGYNAEEAVGLYWKLDSRYGGSGNNGEDMVDHFNIYRNGVLVDQVYQSAVSDSVEYGWHDSGDGSGTLVYGPISHSYSWNVEEPVTQLFTPYTWQVSAVSPSGIEGYLSQADETWGTISYGYGSKPEVYKHSAYYDSGYAEGGEPACIKAWVYARDGDYSSGYELRVWRATGTATSIPAAPSTSGTPYLVTRELASGTYSIRPFVFTDEDVRGNVYYTYTAQMVTYDGDASEPYSFTVKAVEDVAFDSPDVTWSVVDGTTARMRFSKPEGCSASVYCNGSLVKSYSSTEYDYCDFAHDPGTDGEYTYRVDFVSQGITTHGRDYLFERNTTPVDESTLAKVPAAPTLSGRTSGSDNVILSWVPGTGGGAPEGYHIYRTDAGEVVKGYHNSYPVEWGNGRYLTIQDVATYSFVDGRINGYEVNYKGDIRLGRIQGVSWDSTKIPHEYWVTAYNHAGESEPSKVVAFTLDENGNPMAAGATSQQKPSKPFISKVWVEWDDESSLQHGFDTIIGGKLRTAWEDTVFGGEADSWTLEYANTSIRPSGGGNPTEQLLAYQAINDPEAKLGASDTSPALSITARTGANGEIGHDVVVTVTASNTAGEAKSDTASVSVTSFPRLRVAPGTDSVLLQWTDLFNGTNTPDDSVTVNSWEIWRKAEYGLWENVKSLSGSSAYAGTEATNSTTTSFYGYTDTEFESSGSYDYKVVAKCSDGVDRESVVKAATPELTSPTEPPSDEQPSDEPPGTTDDNPSQPADDNPAGGNTSQPADGNPSQSTSQTGNQSGSQVASQPMYRLYNRYSGEHFYTASASERDQLKKLGWNDEGMGWTAPAKSSTPVFRLYNKYAGDHHYTTSAAERDTLKNAGWSYEGIGWYSDDSKKVPLYRQYNPYAATGSHNYTTSKAENDQLVKLGWKAEGVGWYGV